LGGWIFRNFTIPGQCACRLKVEYDSLSRRYNGGIRDVLTDSTNDALQDRTSRNKSPSRTCDEQVMKYS